MTIIPAIDLREGKCVRLMQGDFGRMTIYSDRPAEVAEKWQEKGAERIHLVDLDGSRAGVPRNRQVIEEILQKVSVPVQVGGGIRSIDTVRLYLEAGVRWVILGTAALKDRDFVVEACRLFGGRIILGIDGRDGKVAVEAWTEESARSVEEVAASYRDVGLAAVIYTDIGRDGMERGVNVEATRRLAETVGIPVIASGGVANIEDIKKIKTLERYGVAGVIVGKALYSGALSLEEAIEAGR
ncbi:MAG: 1-(5-phosphoribosyl)-5-[(5-phosphoribosylamino)methylideneamino]imidazole-4-carboxamide isomerase [Syntrophobacterales bacterium]|nr:1-(5-phosphoribosyl)-5-[(5-phosphoribosylamino)methylideneamino]imidazole-4-carboxamide isomerase [Syntrophobacterales bacterium]